MKIEPTTLRNDFHNSTIRMRLRIGRIPDAEVGPIAWAYMSPDQEARANRELCGVAGCTCGGIRGPQATHDGVRLYISSV